MRIRLAVLGLIAALGVAPTAVAQTPGGDSVAGTLLPSQTGTTSFTVDAHSGPTGENPTGTASWHLGGGFGPSWTVDVTCLSVSGNTGVVGFTGVVSLFGEQIPTAGLIRVVDAGGPASAQDSLEWAETGGPFQPGPPVPVPGPTDCSAYPSTFQPFSGLFMNEGGDMVVTDAQASPTSKEQCKNGGWRDYASLFKNQGDCVSFIANEGGRGL